jgi:peptidoglycan hydrolase CwlO-like protein
MSIDIKKLKEVVADPLYHLKYYHGDVQKDLLEILDDYDDSQNLAIQLDDAESTIQGLKEDIDELNQDIRALEKQIENS